MTCVLIPWFHSVNNNMNRLRWQWLTPADFRPQNSALIFHCSGKEQVSLADTSVSLEKMQCYILKWKTCVKPYWHTFHLVGSSRSKSAETCSLASHPWMAVSLWKLCYWTWRFSKVETWPVVFNAFTSTLDSLSSRWHLQHHLMSRSLGISQSLLRHFLNYF